MTEVSVIIPSYKPGNYIVDCLSSFARQTLDCSRFEVIVVLNGCGEPYLPFLQDLITERLSHVRVKLLYEEIAGVSNARNRGIEEAVGEYIAFVDDDDWVSVTYLEELLAKAEPTVLVCSNILTVDAPGGQTRKDVLFDYQKFAGNDQSSLLKVRRLLSSACFKLIPRQMIGNHRFNTHFRLGEDALFMAEISANIQQVCFTSPKAIYYRRARQGSALRSKRTFRQRAENCFSLYGAYSCVYLSNPLNYNLLFFLNRLAAVSKWWFR